MDISEWQGVIDFQKVKATGKIDFAIIRAGTRFGEPNIIDKHWEDNYNGCKANNIDTGAYWFSYALSGADAEREANIFLTQLKGKKFEYPVYIDIEDKSIFAKKVASETAKAFCKVMKANRYYCGVYSSRSFFDSYFDQEVKTTLSIWVAEWAQSTKYKGEYGIWQYTSNGHIDGIKGRVDLDYAYVDFPTIMKTEHWNGY